MLTEQEKSEIDSALKQSTQVKDLPWEENNMEDETFAQSIGDETTPAPAGGDSLPEAPVSWNMKYYDKGGFGCMLTVRSHTLKELIEKVQWVEKNTNALGWKATYAAKAAAQSSTQSNAPAPTMPGGEKMCTIHNVAMKEREGSYGVFHSHARRNDDGTFTYCNGKGYKE